MTARLLLLVLPRRALQPGALDRLFQSFQRLFVAAKGEPVLDQAGQSFFTGIIARNLVPERTLTLP